MRTVPRSIIKSSTEDLTRPTFCIVVKYRVDPKAIGTPTLVKVNIVASSMDSDLDWRIEREKGGKRRCQYDHSHNKSKYRHR